MKLACSEDGSRDGQLMVVCSDLSTAHPATSSASRLQQVLDDWNFLSPQLQDLGTTLQQGKARHAVPWNALVWQAPLPRAFRCIEVLQERKPGGSSKPGLRDIAALWSGPRVAAPASPGGQGVAAGTGQEAPAWRLTPALALFTDDLVAGVEPWAARDAVRLIGLALRWQPVGNDESANASGWAFAPVVVTPDELGGAWRDGQAELVFSLGEGARQGAASRLSSGPSVDAGVVLAEAARHVALQAGTVVLMPQAASDDWVWREGRAFRVWAGAAERDDVFGSISGGRGVDDRSA